MHRSSHAPPVGRSCAASHTPSCNYFAYPISKHVPSLVNHDTSLSQKKHSPCLCSPLQLTILSYTVDYGTTCATYPHAHKHSHRAYVGPSLAGDPKLFQDLEEASMMRRIESTVPSWPMSSIKTKPPRIDRHHFQASYEGHGTKRSAIFRKYSAAVAQQCSHRVTLSQ